jgi:hypothetical protein
MDLTEIGYKKVQWIDLAQGRDQIVVSEWKEIIKNFVAIDGHYNKVLVMNAARCNPPPKNKIK